MTYDIDDLGQPLDAADVGDVDPVELPPVELHWHGDGCPGGHFDKNGGQCVHARWRCNHCHDDPPAGHTCPSCQKVGRLEP